LTVTPTAAATAIFPSLVEPWPFSPAASEELSDCCLVLPTPAELSLLEAEPACFWILASTLASSLLPDAGASPALSEPLPPDADAVALTTPKDAPEASNP